jgi:acyl-CoA oxidase
MILVDNFFEALGTLDVSASTKHALELCFQLYSLNTLNNDAQSFVVTGAITQTSLIPLLDNIQDIMSQIRPHAVCLVDSWKIPDYILNSALGRYDGRVYETIFDVAHRHNPLNKITFNPNWEDEEIVLGSGDANKILSKL